MFISSCFLQSRQRPMLGVDISPTSVSLMQLTPIDNHYRIDSYARCVLPNQTIESHTIKNGESLALCIHNLLTAMPLAGYRAVIAIPDSCCINKIIQIDSSLQARDIKEFMIIETENSIQCSIDDIYFDFQVLGPSVEQSNLVDVQLIATRTKYVIERVNVLRSQGIEVEIVEVQSLAIERAINLFLSQSINQTVVFVDVSSFYVQFYVFHQSAIIFSHEERCTESLLYVGNHHETVSMKVVLIIKRALLIYYSTPAFLPIEQITLSGEGALEAHLALFIQDYFKISTCIANPCEQMIAANSVAQDTIIQDSPMMMTLCGLALRACS